MKDYHINLFWSEEDRCYVADLPDFEYCSALGDTPEEALAEILVAKQGWLEVAQELGKEIPEARYQPAPDRLAEAGSDPAPGVADALRDYHVNLFWSAEDDCYVADIPDLFSCRAFGDTPQEALKEVLIAKALWLQTARERRLPIPQPLYRP